MPKFTKQFVETITSDLDWDLELKGARDLAKKKLGQAAHEKAPAAHKKQVLLTIEDLARSYIEKHGYYKRPESLQKDKKLLQSIILPALGQLKVSHVTPRDIESLYENLQVTPYQANRVRALLSKMFSLAVSWGWREDNPVSGIERYQEENQSRWLNDEELSRLWAILDRYSSHLTAYVFKFLLLTGARKSEALQATWDQFDLEKRMWIKPSHLTKQKRKEHLPLSEKALEVLQMLKKFALEGSPYLFPGRKEGEPLKEIKTFWKTVLQEANLENISIHDLRHALAPVLKKQKFQGFELRFSC